MQLQQHFSSPDGHGGSLSQWQPLWSPSVTNAKTMIKSLWACFCFSIFFHALVGFYYLLEENSAISCILCILFLKLIRVENVHKHSALERAAESSPVPKPSPAGVHVPALNRCTSISCSPALRLAVTNSRSLWQMMILNNEITMMTIVIMIII